MLKKPLNEVNPELYETIKALHEDIWQKHIDPQNKLPWYDEKRELTDDEKNTLFSLLKDKRVICCLFDRFGFTLIISLYSYPSSADKKPEHLISFSQTHIKIRNSGLNGTEKKGEKTAWDVFSKFTHTEENKHLVNFFNLPKIKEKNYYAY